MPLYGKTNLGQNFYPKLIQIANSVGMKPEDLLAVMVSESGLNNSAYESKFKGSGLLGFMPSTLKGLGFTGTWQDFAQLTGEQQLDYVKKIVDNSTKFNGAPFTSAGLYYVANLWPVGLKLPGVQEGDLNTKILEENPERVGKYSKKYYDIGYKISADYESLAYKSNPLFDKDKKGFITLGDMVKQAQSIKNSPTYIKALNDMNNATGYEANAENVNSSTSLESLFTKIKLFLEKLLGLENILASNKNKFLILVNSNNKINSIEFSRILSLAIKKELDGEANICLGNSNVEVECSFIGDRELSKKAIMQLTDAISDAFYTATQKIGGIKINTHILENDISKYAKLDALDTYHRMFHIKFGKK